MIRGKTKSGFEYGIKESACNDMELLDAFAAVDGGDVTKIPKVATMLLGKDGKEKLYDHLRTEDGNVPISAFFQAISEIMNDANERIKNSEPSLS